MVGMVPVKKRLSMKGALTRFYLGLLALAVGAPLASGDPLTCDPRLTGDFRDTLALATEDGDYRRLRENYGQFLSEIVGLSCDAEGLAEILSSVGYQEVWHKTYATGRTEVVGYLPGGWLYQLTGIGRRNLGRARIALVEGKTYSFSIGPSK